MNINLKKVVFTSSNVIKGNTIVIIYHDLEDDWQLFSKNDEFINEEDVKISTLQELVHLDITIKEVIMTLPKGFEAQREEKGDTWNIKLTK